MELNEFVAHFAEQFDETESEVFTPETHFRDLEEWSSFLALGVMAMVKSEYDVNLTAEEMRKAQTIEELYHFVQAKLA